MNLNPKPTPDSFADVILRRNIRTPLLHKVENLVGALVRTLRTSSTGHQASDSVCLKRRLRHVVGLSTYPEGARDIGHRVPINLVTPQHLVAHLHQIARIKELIPPEGIVMHIFGVWMEGPRLAERLALSINGSVRSTTCSSFHMCQCYYVRYRKAVKHIM